MNMSAIQINTISKQFGTVKALDRVSLDVQPGELFGLIGPDGAGKTTLMRILTTLLLPDEGSARVSDWDIKADYRSIRRNVGYMPGRFSLYQDLTVEENLRFFATLFGTTVEANIQPNRTISEAKSRQTLRRNEAKARVILCSCAPAPRTLSR